MPAQTSGRGYRVVACGPIVTVQATPVPAQRNSALKPPVWSVGGHRALERQDIEIGAAGGNGVRATYNCLKGDGVRATYNSLKLTYVALTRFSRTGAEGMR